MVATQIFRTIFTSILGVKHDPIWRFAYFSDGLVKKPPTREDSLMKGRFSWQYVFGWNLATYVHDSLFLRSKKIAHGMGLWLEVAIVRCLDQDGWTDGRKQTARKKVLFFAVCNQTKISTDYNSKLLVWGPVVWDSNRGTPKEHFLSFSGIQSESKRPTQTTAASLLEDSWKQPLLRWCRIWPSYLHRWDICCCTLL